MLRATLPAMEKPTPKMSLIVVGLFAATAMLMLPAWKEIVRPNMFPKRFGVVTEGKVYRSGELTPAALAAVVRENKIKTIVDLGAFIEYPEAEERERQTADAIGAARYQFALYGDATGNANYYLQALRIMNDPEKQPVLVHCGAGTHRTGCAVAMYRTIVEGVAPEVALEEATQFAYDPVKHTKFTEMFNTWQPRVAEALKSGALELAGQEPIPPATPVHSAKKSAMNP